MSNYVERIGCRRFQAGGAPLLFVFLLSQDKLLLQRSRAGGLLNLKMLIGKPADQHASHAHKYFTVFSWGWKGEAMIFKILRTTVFFGIISCAAHAENPYSTTTLGSGSNQYTSALTEFSTSSGGAIRKMHEDKPFQSYTSSLRPTRYQIDPAGLGTSFYFMQGPYTKQKSVLFSNSYSAWVLIDDETGKAQRVFNADISAEIYADSSAASIPDLVVAAGSLSKAFRQDIVEVAGRYGVICDYAAVTFYVYYGDLAKTNFPVGGGEISLSDTQRAGLFLVKNHAISFLRPCKGNNEAAFGQAIAFDAFPLFKDQENKWVKYHQSGARMRFTNVVSGIVVQKNKKLSDIEVAYFDESGGRKVCDYSASSKEFRCRVPAGWSGKIEAVSGQTGISGSIEFKSVSGSISGNEILVQ